MGTVLNRRVRFRATHRYHRPEWDDAKNRAVFGDCAAPEPHAHDYVCDVGIRGQVDANGMVVDLALLDRILDAQIVRPLHDGSLNAAIPEFAPGQRIPTCEELARLLAVRIDVALASADVTARVASVRVAEDDTLSATWFAEG